MLHYLYFTCWTVAYSRSLATTAPFSACLVVDFVVVVVAAAGAVVVAVTVATAKAYLYSVTCFLLLLSLLSCLLLNNWQERQCFWFLHAHIFICIQNFFSFSLLHSDGREELRAFMD